MTHRYRRPRRPRDPDTLPAGGTSSAIRLRFAAARLAAARLSAFATGLVAVLCSIAVLGALSGHAAHAAAPATAQRAAGPVSVYDWPMTSPATVTRGFDPPAFRYGRGHRGVDLAGTPGDAVLSAGPGTVAFAGPVAGRGVVSIDHPGGLRTTYEPVTATVAAGDRVGTGTPIGRLSAGHQGCPAPACLHWGLRDGQGYLDPRSLLGRPHIRLISA